jgi:hypothetical protein
MLCRKLIPTLTLLTILLAPSPGAAAETAAGPPSDEPRGGLAATLRALGDQLATLWSGLTAGGPTSPAGGPAAGPPTEGQGGHDPNGLGTPPAGAEEPTG